MYLSLFEALADEDDFGAKFFQLALHLLSLRLLSSGQLVSELGQPAATPAHEIACHLGEGRMLSATKVRLHSDIYPTKQYFITVVVAKTL